MRPILLRLLWLLGLATLALVVNGCVVEGPKKPPQPKPPTGRAWP